MPIEEEPIVGATYEDEEGRTFEVVSFDEDDGTIAVQFEDESKQEIDLDDWYEMEITRISSPEDEESDDDEDFDDEEEDDDYDEDEEDEDFDEDDEDA